jgi:hypothetical protein
MQVEYTTEMIARFWSKVDKQDGCWLWTGGRNYAGYGFFYTAKGGRIGAHRFAWIVTNGPVPLGKEICHSCDVPACVRPDHLWAGTHKENMNDRDCKGRNKPGRLGGEVHPMARLTANQVQAIRQCRAERRLGVVELAAIAGVSTSTIEKILNGKLWLVA